MLAKTLLLQFQHNHTTIRLNCEGLTQTESLFQPLAEGNCLNWVLGHIVAHRSHMLELLDEAALWTEEESAPYARGSAPITAEVEGVKPIDQLLTDLEKSQERVIRRLSEMTEADLAALVEGQPRGELLAGYQVHEAYHAGQLGVLRRMTGRPGALDRQG